MEGCFVLDIPIKQKPSHKDFFIPGEKRILKCFYEARGNKDIVIIVMN